jgi:hypothetical protein
VGYAQLFLVWQSLRQGLTVGLQVLEAPPTSYDLTGHLIDRAIWREGVRSEPHERLGHADIELGRDHPGGLMHDRPGIGGVKRPGQRLRRDPCLQIEDQPTDQISEKQRVGDFLPGHGSWRGTTENQDAKVNRSDPKGNRIRGPDAEPRDGRNELWPVACRPPQIGNQDGSSMPADFGRGTLAKREFLVLDGGCQSVG